mgnify:CR=1 FL=1
MSQPTPSPVAQPSLVRAMGLGMAVAVVVGNVIGSGIFAKPGRIAAEAGDFKLIMVAWVVGGVLSLMGALSVAELAAMLPQAGGLYVYLREAYGKLTAFLFGWSEFLFHRPASTGALSVMCVVNFSKALGWDCSAADQVMISAGIILSLSFVNIVGVAWGGRMQVVTTVLKVGFIIMIILLPGLMWLLGKYQPQWSNYGTSVTPNQPNFATQFAAAMLAVSWAYDGWHGITPVAEEIKDPQRNVPRALFVGIGVLALLYITANLSYHLVIPMPQMVEPKENQQLVATLTLKEMFGPIGQTLMSVGVMLSTLGAINSNLLYGPRVSFAMGRDRVFFSQLGAVHATCRTPAFAIAVQGLMAVVLVCASLGLTAWVSYFKDKSLFDILTNYIVFSASLFYVGAVASVFVLRKKHPEWERPYRTWGYPWLPAAYIAFYAVFLSFVFKGNPGEALIGVGLIAAGWPVYLIWNRQQTRQPNS